MKVKKFLKPTRWKIMLFAIFLFFSVVASSMSDTVPTAVQSKVGSYSGEMKFFEYPLSAITQHVQLCSLVDYGTENCNEVREYEINYVNLAIDLVFWYVAACLIVFLVREVKK